MGQVVPIHISHATLHRPLTRNGAVGPSQSAIRSTRILRNTYLRRPVQVEEGRRGALNPMARGKGF